MKLQINDWLMHLWFKFKELTTSAKFWAWVLSVATAGDLYAKGNIEALPFLIAVVTATSVYTGSKAYEDSHRNGGV